MYCSSRNSHPTPPKKPHRTNDSACSSSQETLIMRAQRIPQASAVDGHDFSTTYKGAILKPKSMRLLALGAGVALLTACTTAPIPVSENFPLTVQPKVRSAGHWNILSKDVVAQTLDTLSKVGSTAHLYVALPPQASDFDRAFREFLITELVKSGRVVMQRPDNAMEVSYQTQVVTHASYRPHFVPGVFTMLTAGVYAAYGLRLEHLDAKLAGGLGLAAVADTVASVNSGGPTHTELILTTTVTMAGRYLARKTDVYYVEEEDASLFAALQLPKAPRLVKVVGP